MTYTVNGFMLIDAPHSALNNAGNDSSERTENVVRVKAIRKGKKVYPMFRGGKLSDTGGELLWKKIQLEYFSIEREENSINKC